MFLFIYVQPLWEIILFITLAICLWALLCRFFGNSSKCRPYWIALNAILLFISAYAVLYVTLLNRTFGVYDIYPIPFFTFHAAKDTPELYRELLMNTFLFVPFGLTLSQLFPRKWAAKRRVLLVVLLGIAVSIAVEWAQYHFALGTAETDDVICNALGTFLGTLPILITAKAQR